MRFKPLFLITLSVLLTSCVAVVVAGAAAGVIVYDKRSLSMIERDARIFHVLNTRIARDKEFNDSRIIISSFNRVVLLAGQVPTASLRVKAEKFARSTPDVYRVYDELTVDDPVPFSQRTKDTWITGQIRSLMLAKKGLESGSMRIVTENAVVYLMGIATHQQADLAVDVARRVKGVKKVVKIFRYIN